MRGRWLAGAACFAPLVPVLHRVPAPWTGFEPMAWLDAAAIATVLLVMQVAHVRMVSLWSRHEPGRMRANEVLARLLFVAFGVIVVGGHSEGWPRYLGAGLALTAVSSWAHFALLRRQKGYEPATNLAQWGLFLSLLAVAGLWGLGVLD